MVQKNRIIESIINKFILAPVYGSFLLEMDNLQRYFFGRPDKLKSRKLIEQLFKTGRSFSNFPFRVVWLSKNDLAHLQAGVGVSSRYFKKATDRNRIKRLIREAYRLQKNTLQQHLLEHG
ncbi:MAG: ribonuclease P protein component, partial [Ferruginibacter sp.]